MRMPSQNVGQPRRGTEDKRDEADQFWLLAQQRQQASAGAQSGEELVESGERRIRIVRRRKLLDYNRHQLVEVFAGLVAPQRRMGGVPPAPPPRTDSARLAKT